MKYCPYCKVLNEEDADSCKICGRTFEEIEREKEKSTRTKNKNKTKHKTRRKKGKTKKVYKDKREKGKMSFFQKFVMFLLFVLTIGFMAVAGYFGYYIYKNRNIEVPNVIGLTYEDAEKILINNKLNVQKEEEVSEDVGVVIKQNHKSGTKVQEGSVITITVGIKDTSVKVPSLVGLSLDEATTLLNKNNINYKLVYETSDEANKVLKQSIKANTKISSDEVVTLTVSKKKETKNEDKTSEKTKEENKEDENQ